MMLITPDQYRAYKRSKKGDRYDGPDKARVVETREAWRKVNRFLCLVLLGNRGYLYLLLVYHVKRSPVGLKLPGFWPL